MFDARATSSRGVRAAQGPRPRDVRVRRRRLRRQAGRRRRGAARRRARARRRPAGAPRQRPPRGAARRRPPRRDAPDRAPRRAPRRHADGDRRSTRSSTMGAGGWVFPVAEPALTALPLRRTCARMAFPVAHEPPRAERVPRAGRDGGHAVLEQAIDELAVALGLDPLELRRRNHVDVDQASGLPYSSKQLLDVLRPRRRARRLGRAATRLREPQRRRPAARHGLRDADLVGRRRPAGARDRPPRRRRPRARHDRHPGHRHRARSRRRADRRGRGARAAARSRPRRAAATRARTSTARSPAARRRRRR